MIETNENILSYEKFEPLTSDYLESLEIPSEIEEFEVREAINSSLPLYDWDKINYMQENFDIEIPDSWIEEDRKYIVASFKIVEGIVAWKKAVRKGVDKERYLEDLNRKVKEKLLIKEGQEYFLDYPTPKLTQEELMNTVFYVGHFLTKEES
jgi:hypothetical protein